MSLSLKANADGISLDLMVGATVIATFSTTGIEAGGVLLADAATAQGLTNIKKLLTPGGLANAFGGANQLLSANGYQKLPGGLIVQWGKTASIATITSPVQTLPVSFPNACQAVIPIGDNAGTTSQSMNYVGSLTTSSFRIFNQGGVSTAFYWIAIGY